VFVALIYYRYDSTVRSGIVRVRKMHAEFV
jgi:hypothetical protein